jgi:hypothetical protein
MGLNSFLHFWKAHTWTKIEKHFKKKHHEKKLKLVTTKITKLCFTSFTGPPTRMEWPTPRFQMKQQTLLSQNIRVQVYMVKASRFPLETTQLAKNADDMPCTDVMQISPKISKINICFR